MKVVANNTLYRRPSTRWADNFHFLTGSPVFDLRLVDHEISSIDDMAPMDAVNALLQFRALADEGLSPEILRERITEEELHELFGQLSSFGARFAVTSTYAHIYSYAVLLWVLFGKIDAKASGRMFSQDKMHFMQDVVLRGGFLPGIREWFDALGILRG